MSSLADSTPFTLAIALGANLPSQVGKPKSTLITVRPLLQKIICEWIKSLSVIEISSQLINQKLNWYWSSLYQSEPLGGPSNQPSFLNAVALVEGEELLRQIHSESAALNLLSRFFILEKEFGRNRKNESIKWGPRCLDIDLLAWGGLQINNEKLVLPHPYLLERHFVITPLAEALSKKCSSIKQLPPQKGWE